MLLSEELKNEVEPEITELNKKKKCLVVPNFIQDNSFYNNMSKNAIISSKLYSEDRLKSIWSEILK